MLSNSRLERAKELVFYYLQENDFPEVAEEDIFIVWFAKTLENYKVILGSSLPKSPLFEVTYSGQHKDIQLDVYDKRQGLRFKDALD